MDKTQDLAPQEGDEVCQDLYNVHEAMADAAGNPLHPRKSEETTTLTFRLTKRQKELATKRCEMHGTRLSSFLRHCIDGLLKDYGEQA